MFIDANKYDQDVVEADICIIGTVPAGLTVANQFKDSKYSLALIEAGGLENTSETQELYSGSFDFYNQHSKRIHSRSDYTKISRLRFFGGTSNHWSSWCRPLDPVDFENRPWVPNSGWPIQRKELDPYYQRAYQDCELKPVPETKIPDSYIIGEGENFYVQRYHINPNPVRFGKVYQEEFKQTKNISVYYNLNLLKFDVDQELTKVKKAVCQNYSKKNIEVRAKYYLLATGGIENARLLLHSVNSSGKAIGNQNDLVGRYFMEHTHFNLGKLWLNNTEAEFMQKYNALSVHDRCDVFIPRSEAQKREKILNVQFDLDPLLEQDFSNFDHIVSDFTERSNNSNKDKFFCRLRIITEQAPNYDSRVNLGEDKDRLGMYKVKTELKLTDIDFHSFTRTIQLVSRDVFFSKYGRVKYFFDPDKHWTKETFDRCFYFFPYHHMGTTRMSDNPEKGVVDSNCKIHGVKNLSIGGSSVFPTSGHAPPTLTIIALSHRIADNIKQELGK